VLSSLQFFRQNFVYTFLIFPCMIHASPISPFFIDFPNNVYWRVQLWSLSCEYYSLWDVTPCSFIDGYHRFGGTCGICRRRRQQISLKRWLLPTKLQGVRSQKTLILIAQELFNDSFPKWAGNKMYKGHDLTPNWWILLLLVSLKICRISAVDETKPRVGL
jgi:hypothetical protein